MENKCSFTCAVFVLLVSSVLPHRALAEPSISDRPQTVDIHYENKDRLKIICDESDRCDYEIEVFGQKFRLNKNDVPIADAVIPNTASLTPVWEKELSYYIQVSIFCNKDDFKRWGEPHSELNCSALIKAKANRIDSVEKIVEKATVVTWDKSGTSSSQK